MSIIVQSNPYIAEAGTYEVTVDSIDFVDNPYKPGQQQLEVGLSLVEDGTRTTRFFTAPSLHPKGKLVPFCEALLKRSLNDTELSDGFDVEELIGKELKVVLEEVVKEDGEEYLKVASFMPSEAKEDKEIKEDMPF